MIRRYPALFVLGCILLGIVLTDLLQVSAWIPCVAVLVVAAIGVGALYHRRIATAVIAFSVGLGAVAALQYSLVAVDLPRHHLAKLVLKPTLFQVYGQISDWPDIRQDRTDILVSVDSLRGADRTTRATGSVLLKISDTTTALQHGDRLEFVARLYPVQQSEDHERFSYRRYLKLKGIAAMAYMPTMLDIRVSRRSPYGLVSLADRLRTAIVDALHSDLSEQAAALALGFLIGETRDISPELYGRFRDSGTLHLLAVSGSNVGLIAGVLLLLLRPFLLGRAARGAVLLLGLVLFSLMSYLEPSVVRACVMAALVIFAGMVNRRYDLNHIIALTAVIVLLVRPTQLFEIGFQLSFVTAWGLIAFVPPVIGKFKTWQKHWWFRFVIIPIIVSFVAQLCSAPIIAYYFQQISVLTVPANLVVVPLVAVSVIGVVLVLLAHLIIPAFGYALGALLSPFMNLVVAAVQFFGRPSVPRLELPPHIPSEAAVAGMLLVYLVLALTMWGIQKRSLRRWAVLMGVISLNALLVYGVIAAQTKDPPQLIAVNIPGGVMIAITSPANHSADLIITGARARPFPIDSVVIADELKQDGISKISRLVVMAADYDALDDLLRLAVAFRADSLYFRSGLRAPAQEVMAAHHLEALAARVTWYSHCSHGLTGDGLLVDEALVQYRSGNMQAIIVAQDHLIPEGAGRGTPENLLVVGNLWYAQPDDWIRLHDSGFTGMICARLAQRFHPDDKLEAVEIDQAPPDYVHDLTADGPYRRPLIFR